MFHSALNEYVTHLGLGKEVYGRNIQKLIRIFYFVSPSEALLLSIDDNDWVGNMLHSEGKNWEAHVYVHLYHIIQNKCF